MILIALLVGVVLVVAAIRNSQAALFTALGQDVPEFVVWAAALFAVGVLGYVPGLKPVSRGLLALVIVVIILNNYQNILNGFQALAKEKPPASPSTNTSPATGGTTAAPSTAAPSSGGSTAGGVSLLGQSVDSLTSAASSAASKAASDAGPILGDIVMSAAMGA